MEKNRRLRHANRAANGARSGSWHSREFSSQMENFLVDSCRVFPVAVVAYEENQATKIENTFEPREKRVSVDSDAVFGDELVGRRRGAARHERVEHRRRIAA